MHTQQRLITLIVVVFLLPGISGGPGGVGSDSSAYARALVQECKDDKGTPIPCTETPTETPTKYVPPTDTPKPPPPSDTPKPTVLGPTAT